MNNLNSVLLEGNLAKDPEIREVSGGKVVAGFCLALNRYFKSADGYKKEVVFIDIDAWGKLADVCQQRMTKGSGVRVIGRLKQDSWESSDGQKKSKIKVVADHLEVKPATRKQPLMEESA
jgi:single-strand DNA-binding protein